MLWRILSRSFSKFEKWKKAADAELKLKDSWKKFLWNTNEGIAIRPVYFAEDAIKIPDVPGEFPFMRGPSSTMYTHKPWTIRQPSVFNTIEESNAFYKASIAAGQQVLNVYFDLATNRGYDSDNPIVKYDVGRNGVPIDTVDDMRELFNGIPLANINVNIAINGAALPIMAMFIVTAGEQCALLKRLQGTIENDILKEFLGKNSFIYPPGSSMKIVSDIISYIAQHLPKYNPISISGYHMKEAGAGNKLELAFTLANGLEYIRYACNAGLTVDQIAPRLNFFFGVGMDFYMEIAKLRAARFLWAELLKEKFDPKNTKSLALRANCQTSMSSITAHDPLNNIVRTAIEATASVLGGTQSLYTHGYDEAVGGPTENSARIAKNTQSILQEETGITKVADPWGGSYFMENLTKELADAALGVINEIESLGGMTKAIESGIARKMILEDAARRRAKIDSGEETIVGVNKYKVKDEEKMEAQNIDYTHIREEQIRKINQLKATRDNSKVADALDNLRIAAKTGQGNLLELAIEAARARATLGEVSKALEDVYGRYSLE
ncbi:unnamed protein product [Blepharisma stoltei]|uniref:Methylmalonyl-CoA mutase alpha/beta chain catalytic domain-containing protein n=1 Tax=Blepharisma stoltei TaxID=1481888 RepID=A0AAU9KFU4_9CILI|nr:unnamed protein product [Blepharisma stoltei]